MTDTVEPVPARPRVAPAPEPAAVDVSILIVTWNSARWITRCLESLPAACDGLEWELIVWDNASTDGTLDQLGETGEIIRSPKNEGFATGMNRSFARSRGRYLFLLNPDCELAPGVVRELKEFLDSTGAAMAAPRLTDYVEGHRSQDDFQFRRFPTLRSLSRDALGVSRLFPRSTARHRYRHLDLTRPQRVEQPAGAALLVRSEVFEKVGKLDESFSPAWYEDVDFCRRVAAAGEEIWAVPTAPVRHYGGSSLEFLPFETFNEVWYRNMWRYARKWLGWRAEVLRWVIVGSMVLRCGAALAGLAHPEVGRLRAFRAYANVLRKALQRWDDSSRSSS